MGPEDIAAHVQRVIHLSFVAGGQPRAAVSWQGAGSNAWAVAPSRSASGHAMLLANPHLPWGGMTTWFEAQLQAPGVDAYGAALVGFPLLGIAFNDHLGWTHTNNPMDGADLYELELVEGGYRWDGGVRAFEQSLDTLRVRQEDGTLGAVPLTLLRSVHGPVLARREDRAVALRLAGLDRPYLMEQYWEMVRATSLEEFEAALRRLQMPFFNVLYADRDGHVLYLFGGCTPRRPHGDRAYWQGLVPGNTSATLWTECHDYDELPRLVDPPGGWLQNANDPPWTATVPSLLDPADFPPYLAPAPRLGFRQQRSVRMLSEDESITFEELIEYKHSTRRELADRILDDLLRAVEEHGGDAVKPAAAVLAAWDRRVEADSRGAVLFDAWFAQTGGQPFLTPWQADDPLGTPSGLADPAGAVAALEMAAVTGDRGPRLPRRRLGRGPPPAPRGPGPAGQRRPRIPHHLVPPGPGRPLLRAGRRLLRGRGGVRRAGAGPDPAGLRQRQPAGVAARGGPAGADGAAGAAAGVAHPRRGGGEPGAARGDGSRGRGRDPVNGLRDSRSSIARLAAGDRVANSMRRSGQPCTGKHERSRNAEECAEDVDDGQPLPFTSQPC